MPAVSPPTISRSKPRKSGFDGDVYDIDGKPYVRVTRVLNGLPAPALVAWQINQNRDQVADVFTDAYSAVIGKDDKPSASEFRKMGLEWLGDARRDRMKANRAADKGKEVHDYIQVMLQRELGIASPLPELPPEFMPGIEAWNQWRKAVGLRPRFVEFRVHDDDTRTAGTLDCFAEVNGKLFVVDWKTTTGIYPNHKVQGATYLKHLEKMGHGPIDGVICVLVPTPKEGKDTPQFQAVTVDDRDEIERLWSVFRACLHIYRWQEECR